MQKGISGDQRSIRQTVRRELEDARRARKEGNEGRARVCARRAAGWAVSAMRHSPEKSEIESNAYVMLQWLSQQADHAHAVRCAAIRLTARVSLDHTLPFAEDPLDDAQIIIEALLGTDWASAEVE